MSVCDAGNDFKRHSSYRYYFQGQSNKTCSFSSLYTTIYRECDPGKIVSADRNRHVLFNLLASVFAKWLEKGFVPGRKK